MDIFLDFYKDFPHKNKTTMDERGRVIKDRASLEAWVEGAYKRLGEKDKKIKELEGQIAQCDDMIESYKKTVKELEERLKFEQKAFRTETRLKEEAWEENKRLKAQRCYLCGHNCIGANEIVDTLSGK